MAQREPVNVQELFKLQQFGVPPDAIGYGKTSMESDKFIVVRNPNEQKVTVINAYDRKTIMSTNMRADAAVMNPVSQVLAVKGNGKIQVFNIEMKTKMKEYTTTSNIVFWKWISEKTLALVTDTHVLHWNMQSDKPKKVFERRQELANSSIINYVVDSTEKWCMLIALAKGTGGSASGILQLYSVERDVSQKINGHAGGFVDFTLPNTTTPTTLVVIASNTGSEGKLYINEVPKQKSAGEASFSAKSATIKFSSPQDFPVALQASSKYGVTFIITRAGFLFVYDIETATCLFTKQITNDPMFASAKYGDDDGLVGVTNKSGQVLAVTVDENNMVPFINETLRNPSLAVRLASRAGLPGAEDLFHTQFNKFINDGNIPAAVKVAVSSPNGMLRTQSNLQRLQHIPTPHGQKPPLSQYFQYVIENDQLNQIESVELAKVVLQKPAGIKYLADQYNKGKITPSEDLGDLVRPHNAEFAMKLYSTGGSHSRMVSTYVEAGDFDKVLDYCKTNNYQPDWIEVLKETVNTNPDNTVGLALHLKQTGEANIDPNVVVDILMQRNYVQQTVSFLLKALGGDKEEEGDLQTRCLEIALQYAHPRVADRILESKTFSKYDHFRVAQLCEEKQLFQRALQNYSKVEDIIRVLLRAPNLPQDWLVDFFADLSEEDVMTCLKRLMSHNPRQNMQLCVRVATSYSDYLGPHNLIELFESFKSFEALFYYLGATVGGSEDPDVHFKYIEAATKVGQFQEVERITRESDVYEPERAKKFLMDTRLSDQWPLINVCDRHGYEEELVKYLFKNSMLKYVELYVQKRNPMKTPKVVGALLDVDCNEDFIKSILSDVGHMCPVEPLVEEVEKRNSLKILLPWLEAREKEGSQEPALHNALAKVYVDMNNGEQFLLNNQFYESKVVGKYCEKRDPHLSFVAFERGQCDDELIDMTNKNGMFKQQAKYLVQRKDPELWAKVLTPDNEYQRQLIDQVSSTALPAATNPEEVFATVKAFKEADLPNELIELLEKIVLQGAPEFRQNKNLQNLLILMAIRADKSRVMDYINRLDNYDGGDIAQIACEEGLYEEAFAIHKKFEDHLSATDVLIQLGDIDRALEYAERVQEPEVWNRLGRAQLEENLVSDAIESFIKAEDASSFHEVIQAAESAELWDDLIKYLNMARLHTKDEHIDTELCYSYAKSERLADLEEFISGSTVANIQDVGDRCFDQSLFQPAKILYTSISHYGRLASTLVYLEDYHSAFEAARKANTIRTWKEVNKACVEAEEFRLAQMCGSHIVIHADELEDLIRLYEWRGHFDQIMSLIETNLGHERAHMGMFTELGVLYAKHKPEKLMEHITRFWRRINIAKLLIACERHHRWAEMRTLYMYYEEYDNAVRVMMEHSPDAWEHETFKDCMSKVANMELLYRAIHFYLDEQPKLINDLLEVMKPKLDHERVVREIRKTGFLPIIKPYLEDVQQNNLHAVNEAYNDLLIEEENFEALRASITDFNNFDQIGLAQRLEKDDLLEFRRIASAIYKQNKRWKKAVTLLKQDKLYKDAMEIVATSRKKELADDLLHFFMESDLKECFAACLYTCYDLISPDVALELAWRENSIDFVMPFMVQTLKEYTTKVDDLEERLANTAGVPQQAVSDMSSAHPSESYQDPDEVNTMFTMPPIFSQGGFGPPPPPSEYGSQAPPDYGYPRPQFQPPQF
eukprot:gb/GECH01011802.1/.p1 GENE.gb/GECH01011802.1/~~gb/GECH01011802.1/.p1  ORF type:complete len:1690 (+),score=396.56 gb/GECH01011802.1/:1-5070(+)